MRSLSTNISCSYVALSGLDISQKLDTWSDKVETVFFFLNLFLFVLNISTLAAQAIRTLTIPIPLLLHSLNI